MSERASELIGLLEKRSPYLEAVAEGPKRMRTLVTETDTSRSTVNRAVRELEAAGLVRNTHSGYELSSTGELCLHAYRQFVSTLDTIQRDADVFASFEDLPFDPFMLTESEIVSPEEPAIYRPLDRIHEQLAGSATVRAVLPKLASARTLQIFRDVLADGGSVDLLVSEELWPVLLEEFESADNRGPTHDSLCVSVGELPDIGLFLTGGADPLDTTLLVLLYDAHSVQCAVISEADAPVGWADRYFQRLAADSDERTEQIGK